MVGQRGQPTSPATGSRVRNGGFVHARSSSGRATLSYTVRDDSKLKCWNTIPMSRRAAQLRVVQLGQVAAIDDDFCPRGPVEQVDNTHQRAFARAAAPDDAGTPRLG